MKCWWASRSACASSAPPDWACIYPAYLDLLLQLVLLLPLLLLLLVVVLIMVT
jgi:hypothetical protein